MENYRPTNAEATRQAESIPIEQRLKAFNTYDLIKYGASLNPEAPALSFFLSGDAYEQPMVTSYAELVAQITRVANMLHDLGLKPGDVVSYVLPNAPQTFFTLYGGEACCVVNPINPMLEAATMKEIMQAAGSKVLVALGEVPGIDIWQKIESIRGDLPNLKAVLRVFGPSDEANGIYGFDELLPRYSGDKLDSGRLIDPRDLSSIFHTGGTTGTPKLAPRIHFNEVCNAQQLLMNTDMQPGEAVICGLPLFHVNAAMVTGLMPWYGGGNVVLASPSGYRDVPTVKNFFRIVEHYKAIAFSAAPTVLAMLMEADLEGVDTSSLRFAICGAAPLSVEMFKRFEKYTGLSILEGYGLTEGACASSANPLYGQKKVGSIGLRLPYQEMEIHIVDGEGKFVRRADVDEIGSVCIKGPNVFMGYMDPAHNKGIWSKEGWFNTGDLGRMDADEYFWLTGRKKELIIRGGHNIDPAVIEDCIYKLPGVAVAAAVGRPDPYAGEVPVAYVELQPGAKLDQAEILRHLKNNLGERAAVPKDVTILEQVPLTPVGKVFKPAMRYDAVAKAYSGELGDIGGLARSVEVKVGEDKVHGTLARILVQPAVGADQAAIEAKTTEILANYTVRYQVELI